jgi:HPt (histidine-containing phosphotransfer) domain-containing protein
MHANDNPELYRRLLKRFATSAGKFNDRFCEATTQGDMESAIRQVHTLKGNAGTISATEVQATAAALEQALQAGESHQGPLEAILNSLAPLLTGMVGLETNETPKQVTEPTSELIASLQAALAEHDAEAVVIGNKLALTPFGQTNATEVTEMLRHLGNYDFEQASEVLVALQRAATHG